MFYVIAEYDLRIDWLPPCPENGNNPARLSSMDLIKRYPNKFYLNGSLIVNQTIEGRLEVSIFARIIKNYIFNIFVLALLIQ